jgi:hypothetical protein
MTRKKWVAKTDITPSILKLREKRKWQIALRRYVLEKLPCVEYAPYFGLDINNMRKWFELQFKQGISWDNFGKLWQFEHIVPVAFFDFSQEEELKLCWNFSNTRVAFIEEKELTVKIDLSASKTYFAQLYQNTSLSVCIGMIRKIEQIQTSNILDTSKQQDFILMNKAHIQLLETFDALEFEMLNRGRSMEEVKKESALLKKFGT